MEDEGDRRIRDDSKLSGKQINLIGKFMVIGFDLYLLLVICIGNGSVSVRFWLFSTLPLSLLLKKLGAQTIEKYHPCMTLILQWPMKIYRNLALLLGAPIQMPKLPHCWDIP